jgi:enterochelin esterase-like enzyme
LINVAITCFCMYLLTACQAATETPIVLIIPSPTPTNTPTLTPTIQVPTATQTPLPSPTPPLICNDLHGSTLQTQVEDKKFAKPLDVFIYLPPCYSDTYPGGYPVLYLLHGQSFSDDQWVRLGVPETADSFFISGELKPFIVVMPREEHYLEVWFHSTFGDNLVEGLVPWVDARYHTCSQRSCWAIGGLSRGATWAVVLELTHWEMFGSMGLHSLPDSPYTEATLRDQFMAMQPKGFSRIYLDIGDADGLRMGAQKYKDYLDKYHIPHEWHLNHGGHDEEYWHAQVPEYLLWYGQAWK